MELTPCLSNYITAPSDWSQLYPRPEIRGVRASILSKYGKWSQILLFFKDMSQILELNHATIMVYAESQNLNEGDDPWFLSKWLLEEIGMCPPAHGIWEIIAVREGCHCRQCHAE